MIYRFLVVIALLLFCFYGGLNAVNAQDADSGQSFELNEDKADQDAISLDKSEIVDNPATVSTDASEKNNKKARTLKAKKSLEKAKKKIESQAQPI